MDGLCPWIGSVPVHKTRHNMDTNQSDSIVFPLSLELLAYTRIALLLHF